MYNQQTQSKFISSSANFFSIANTLFGMIVMYFIFLYSSAQQGKGWAFLTFVAKWYLIIMIGIFGLFLLMILIFLLSAIIVWMGFYLHKK